MKRFILQTLLFLFPFILFFGGASLFLYLSGENFKSIDTVLKSDSRYILGYAYNQGNDSYIKWYTLANKPKFDVWALGSSRALQFRRGMFDVSFYNAGRTISGVTEFKPFLEGLDASKYPEYLIINLDQWMFNKDFDDLKGAVSKDSWSKSFVKNPEFETIWNTYKDLFKGKYTPGVLGQKFDTENIGLMAKAKNQGIRNDGSRHSGDNITTLLKNDSAKNDRFLNADSYKRIKNGNMRFEHGSEVNPEALQKLDDFLIFCTQHKIQVIAFLPPFGNRVLQKMKSTGKYSYIDKIFPLAQPIFAKYHFELYDYTSLSTIGSNENEILDGFHGGETTYAKILIDMLNHGSILNKVTSVTKLTADMKKSQNRYIVYPY